ncbi:hypothetical protein QQS21_004199 [Conoideocrella luteorostrata]|uniref:UbiA prenyltransferase n=1 Tax=Conoideocrella luteorostrata TaxID=1105319 RepID=A0AAJ0CRU4_9HYPO|nr:hypothetical protein QQS21_004199 [Conoideocrella luteorostrata]
MTNNTVLVRSKEQVKKGNKNSAVILNALQLYDTAIYHLNTIWLFTFSDIKTIIVPTSLWGVFNALSGPCLTSNNPNNSASETRILKRIPLVVFWTWIMLLPFCINNQRRPEAIMEDKIGKGWRPLPAQRLTPVQATRLMYTLFAAEFVVSYTMSTTLPCIMGLVLGYGYNDLGGSERVFTRNLINSLGFSTFGLGASLVSMGSRHHYLNSNATLWFLVIGMVIFTTVHTQDMHDREGDRVRGRRTLPLVIGDHPTRWVTALTVTTWSFLCPRFWDLPWTGYVVPVAVGGSVSIRTLWLRSIKADKQTFQIWCFWTLSLYALPAVKHFLAEDKTSCGAA